MAAADDAEEAAGRDRMPAQRSYGSSLPPFSLSRIAQYELLSSDQKTSHEDPHLVMAMAKKTNKEEEEERKKSPHLQPDLPYPPPPPQKFMNRYALLCALLASMNSTLLGYDVGVISGALLFIKQDLKISEVEEEVLVATLSLVSLGGGAMAGRLADAVGRRWTMALSALVFLMGASVMGLAPSFAALMMGRVLAGFGVGLALMVAPVYTAEISPPSIRGSLVSLPEIFINFGILLGYVSNYALSGLPPRLAWRVMLGLGIVPALMLAAGVAAMPESPRWLVMRRRIGEARAVIERTSGSRGEAEERLREIMEAAGLMMGSADDGHDGGHCHAGDGDGDGDGDGGDGDAAGKHVWKELLWPSGPVRRMLIVASGIQFFQQATGIDATVYYSPAAFKRAGMGSESAVIAGTVAMGFTKCAFILVAVLYLDRLGRRPLLLASTAGITASLACIAIAFSFLERHGAELPGTTSSSSSSTSAAFVVLFVCSYVAFFSIGMGPICWVLTAEIFPLRLRAQAMSLGVVINRLSSTLVSLTFLSLSSAISFAGTYLAFAAISLCSVAFVFALVPETKGRSLEEIAKFFSNEANELPPPTPCPVHRSVEMMLDVELPLVDANGCSSGGGGVVVVVVGDGDVVDAGDGDGDDEEGKVKLLNVPLSSDYR